MLAETLTRLTINDAGYYEPDSSNVNCAKGNPTSDVNMDTHTTDGKNRKITDTSKGDLQQTLLSNRTYSIITTTIDPQIDNMVANYGASLHKLATPQTMEVTLDATHRSAWIL